MLIDARSIPPDTVIDADICVVGAGAAGITLSRALIGQPMKVCLLESGGLEFDGATQDLYRGQVTALPYFDLDVTRLRFFGGSTNHWNGGCRPLDPDDFEAKPWIEHSGWPISRSELDPYYERAFAVTQIGPDRWDVQYWSEHVPEFYTWPAFGGRLRAVVTQKSPPTRFGEVYRDDLEKAENVETYLHANVVDIETNDSASVATRVRVACLDGNRWWVNAKIYVLAMGGIENARMLLAANSVAAAGLGNARDLVGRFFQDHLFLDAARIMPAQPREFANAAKPEWSKPADARLSLKADVFSDEHIAKFAAFLVPQFRLGQTNPSKAYGSFQNLAHQLEQAAWPRALGYHIKNMLSDLGDFIDDATFDFSGQAYETTLVNAGFEQVPNPDSRVTLGTERDSLDVPRVQLEWRLTSFDKYSMRRAMEIVGEEFGEAGLGRLQIAEWVLSDDLSTYPGDGAHHHSGTTRMSHGPETGVVDRDGRVHGIANLYVAGSSVFPNIGWAQPTFTIVALALRLADHLKGALADTITPVTAPEGGAE